MDSSPYQIYTSSQEAWAAMEQALILATRSIHWELYTFNDDYDVGKRFAEILEAKAKAGLDVKLVVDALGSYGLSKRRVKSLRRAGVDVQIFHERKRGRGWWRLLWSRTHRKILIIDEEVGFIGGVNIDASAKDWLDIHVQVQGPIVAILLRSLARMYVIAGGDWRRVRKFFRYIHHRLPTDEQNVVLIDNRAHRRMSRLRKSYFDAIMRAKERIILFSPYYFPDKSFLFAIWRARKHGIRIDLLLPASSDIGIATYATRTWFTLLTKMGVHVYQLGTMMHGKGIVVDNNFAIVGSGNLDQTSFYDNYEASIAIKDLQFVAKLKATLEGWILNAKEVDAIVWKNRGRVQQFKERLALHLYRIWHRR
jgi:cardiolipin synthase